MRCSLIGSKAMKGSPCSHVRTAYTGLSKLRKIPEFSTFTHTSDRSIHISSTDLYALSCYVPVEYASGNSVDST